MQRETYINIFKVVFPGTDDLNITVPFSSVYRNGNGKPSAQIGSGKRFVVSRQVEAALVDNFAAQPSCFRKTLES